MLTVNSARPDNIIIFGASGFNRQFVVEEAQSAEGPSGSLKWALAGQSRQWLEGGLNQASKIEIITAGVSEADSWAIMCQQGLVVLNCVGPVIMSVVVVETWEEGGVWLASHSCGPELSFVQTPKFLERMQLDQLSSVIGSCGFDSIPADMSILYTRDQFKANYRHRLFHHFVRHTKWHGMWSHKPLLREAVTWKAVTWKSAIYGFADSGSLRKLRKKFGHQPLPIVGKKVKKRYWQISDFPEFSFGVFTKAGPSRKQALWSTQAR
ncbi:saccharopine dehydrogenase-like oxidoreductase [Salvelinus alpinus]